MDDQLFRSKMEQVTNPEHSPVWGQDTAAPMNLSGGKRIEVEFWCGECRHYTYVKLNTGLEGNHIMVCPQCGHKHYRLVKNGVITSDRYAEGAGIADEIIAMRSACVPADQRRKRGNIAILREMEAVGILR